jgi:hypothetical protein
MRHTYMLIVLSGTFPASMLNLPAQAQMNRSSAESVAPQEVTSVKDCRPPADAKEAQVLAFDKTTLEAKLAVSLLKDEFKVVTVKIWDRPQDPRPLVPVMEAARITQGKLQFYSPNLNADPEPIHDKQFLLVATLGGAQLCWATESSFFKEGSAGPKAAAEPTAARSGRRGG